MNVQNLQNYQRAQMLSIQDAVDNIVDNMIDGELFLALVDYVNIAKNKDFTEEFFYYLRDRTLSFDMENLYQNFNSLFNNRKDLFLTKKNRNFFIYALNNLDVGNFSIEQQSYLSKFIGKLFHSSYSVEEKQQIVSIVSKFLPDELSKKEYRYFNKVKTKDLSLEERQKVLDVATNNFFSKSKDRKIARKRLKDKFIKFLNDLYTQEDDENKENAKMLCDVLKDEIERNFDYETYLDKENFIEKLQSAKIAIYVMNNEISTYQNNKNNRSKKILKIQEVARKIISAVNKTSKNTDPVLVDMFCKYCEISSQTSGDFHEKDVFSIKDVLKEGKYSRQNIDDVFNDIGRYSNISFIEINDSDIGNKIVHTNEIKKEDGTSLVVYFNKNQRKVILNALYSNKEACRVIGKLPYNNEQLETRDIKDFAKIFNEIEKNSILTVNYEDVYRKFFLLTKYSGLGGINNDRSLNVRENSDNSLIKTDISNYTISSGNLLEMLKMQALSNSNINELKVQIDDLQNLKKIFNDYIKFINEQVNINNNRALTPVMNLTIKCDKDFTKDQMMEICNYFSKEYTKILPFKELRIDNQSIKDWQSEREQHQYVIYGTNDIFDEAINVSKRSIQDDRCVLANINKGDVVMDLVSINENEPAPKFISDLNEMNKINSIYDKIIDKVNDKETEDDIISTETSTDTDTDVDLQVLLNLKKPLEELKDFNDKDAITEENINKKMEVLLSEKNNRLSPEAKQFLKGLQIYSMLDWKKIFRKLTNREYFSNEKKEILEAFKGYSYKFTPEAFLSLVYDYFNIGFSRWNGSFGVPELKYYYIKGKDGRQFPIVGVTVEKKEEQTKPIMQMFSNIPKTTSENKAELLLYKENTIYLNKFNNIKNLIDNKNSGLYKVFFANISMSSIEQQCYVGKNYDKIQSFLLKYKRYNGFYKQIVDVLCRKLSSKTTIGRVQSVSIVDPVKLAAGIDDFISFINDLFYNDYIDTDFIKNITKFINNTSVGSIQKLYIELLTRKINVAKAIIIDRMRKDDTINVNINSEKEVLKYIKDHAKLIGSEEYKDYVNRDFNYLFGSRNVEKKDKAESQLCIVNCFDNFNIGNSFLNGNKLDTLFTFSKKDGAPGEYYVDSVKSQDTNDENTLDNITLRELHLMRIAVNINRKVNRLDNGEINDSLITNQYQKMLIGRKIKIMNTIYNLSKKFNEAQQQEEQEKELKRIDIFTHLFDRIWKGKENNIEIEYILDNIEKLTEDEIETLMSVITDESESLYEYFVEIAVNKNKNYLDICSIFQQKKQNWMQAKNSDELKQYRKAILFLSSQCKSSEICNSFLSPTVLNSKDELFDGDIVLEIDLNDVNKYKKENFLAKINEKLNGTYGVSLNDLVYTDKHIEKFAEDINDSILIEEKKELYKTLLGLLLSDKYFGDYSLLLDEERMNEISVNEIEKKCSNLASLFINNKILQLNFNNVDNGDENNEVEFSYKDIPLQPIKIINLLVEAKNCNLSILKLSSSLSKIEDDCKLQFVKAAIKLKQKANELNLDFDVNDFAIFAEKITMQNICDIETCCSEYLVRLMSINCIELSQKNNVFNILNNNSALNIIYQIEKIDNFYKKNKKNKANLSQNATKKLVGKIINEINFCSLNNETIGLVVDRIFTTLEYLNVGYTEALKENNKDKANNILNFIGNLNLSINEYSLADIYIALENINANKDDIFVKNNINDIFNYFLKNGDKSLKYEEVVKLIETFGSSYLNSGYTTDELRKILQRYEEQNAEKKDIIDTLNSVSKEIKQLNKQKDADRNKQTNKDIERTLDDVNKVFIDTVNNIYKNKSNSKTILAKITKQYTNKDIISPEELGKTENIQLLKKITQDGNRSLFSFDVSSDKLIRTIEYVNYYTKILLDAGENKINQLIEDYKITAGTKGRDYLDSIEKLEIIAAFCAKHVLDQNKALRPEQLTAVILETYLATSSVENQRSICKLATGTGKTLTLLFNMFYAGLNKRTPITLTTNQLLVDEMMGVAEKNSIFKGKIYFINDKQEIVEKHTNRIVPLSEIQSILNDKTNLFFSTYSNFDFWRKKMLLNNGKEGVEIVKYITQNAQLGLDEVDSLMDLTSTNKLSVASSSTEIRNKYKQIIEFENHLHDVNNEQEVKSYIDNNHDNFQSSSDYDMLHRYICAKKMELGKHYTVEKVDGYHVIYPIKYGVPDKSGSKYDKDIDLALKIILSNKGYVFKDLLFQTNVIEESCNFEVFKYAKNILGVSGTISGVDEVWGEHGFVVNNLQQTNPKLLNTCIASIHEENACLVDNDDKNIDVIFIATLLYESLHGEVEKSVIFDYLSNTMKLSEEKKEILKKEFVDTDYSVNDNSYRLCIFDNGNDVELYKQKLQELLTGEGNIISYVEDKHGLKVKVPTIISLDQRTDVVDEQTVKDKLKDDKNCFVFALKDRARGFDFPAGSHVIASEITNKELDEQICGRTGRNGQLGYITYAYRCKQKDIEENEDKEIMQNGTPQERFKLIKKIQEKYTEKYINSFNNKYFYLSKRSEYGDKLSLFLNLITEKLDKENRNKTFEECYPIISKFNDGIANTDVINDFDKQEEYFYNLLYYIYNKYYKYNRNEKCLPYEYFTQRLEYEFIDIRNNVMNAVQSSFNPTNININERIKLISNDNGSLEVFIDDQNKYELTQEQKNNNIIICSMLGLFNNCGYNVKNYHLTDNKKHNTVKLNKVKSEKDDALFSFLDNDDDIKNNAFIDFDNDLLIAKKQVLLKNRRKNEIEVVDRNVCFINVDSEDGKIPENITKKLHTLDPKRSLIIMKNKSDVIDFMFNEKIIHIKPKTIIDSLGLGKGIQDNEVIVYIIRTVVKYYTEHGEFPSNEDINQAILDEINKPLGDVGKINVDGANLNKLQDGQLDEEKFKLQHYFTNVKIKNIVNALVRNGIEYGIKNDKIGVKIKDGKNEPEEISSHIRDDNILSDEEDYNDVCNDFREKLMKFKDLTIDITEEDKKKIESGETKLSSFIAQQIEDKIKKITKLKDSIEESETLFYQDKEELLSMCDILLSKDNLKKHARRILLLTNSIANMEFSQRAGFEYDNIDNMNLYNSTDANNKDDNWKNDIRLDNIESIEVKIEAIKKYKEKAKNVSANIKDNLLPEEEGLRKQLIGQHNNIEENIDLMEQNLNTVKEYKRYLDNVNLSEFKLESFDDDVKFQTFSYVNKGDGDSYSKHLKLLNKNKKKILSKAQQENIKKEMIDSNIKHAVKQTFNEKSLPFIFSVFSLRNNDANNIEHDPLFQTGSDLHAKGPNDKYVHRKKTNTRIIDNLITSSEREIFKVIKNKYEEIFGSGVTLQGFNNENLTEEQKQRVEQFQSDVVDILIANRDNLSYEEDKKKIDEEFPINVYNFFGKTMERLHSNFKENQAEQRKIIESIKKKMEHVVSGFNGIAGLHGVFKATLLKYCKQLGIPGLTNDNILTQQGINYIADRLYSYDIDVLKRVNKMLSGDVVKDYNDSKEKIDKMIEEKNDIPTILKFIIVFITLGTVLFTDKGRKMFKKKEKQDNIEYVNADVYNKDYNTINNDTVKEYNKDMQNLL